MTQEMLDQAKERATIRLAEADAMLAKIRHEWQEALAKGWNMVDALDYYGGNAVRMGQIAHLYRILLKQSGSLQGWRAAYGVALRVAMASVKTDSVLTSAVAEQQAAASKQWMQENARYLSELGAETLGLLPYEM